VNLGDHQCKNLPKIGEEVNLMDRWRWMRLINVTLLIH